MSRPKGAQVPPDNGAVSVIMPILNEERSLREWLHKGQLIQRGHPDDIVAAYTKFLEVGEDALTLEDI